MSHGGGFYQIQADPFPEDDILCHDVSLHLALHLDVEDLKGLLRFEGDDLGGRVHDGGVGRDGAADGVDGVRHVDDHNLIGVADLLANADELVRLHRQAVEPDVGRADADVRELANKTKKLTTGRAAVKKLDKQCPVWDGFDPGTILGLPANETGQAERVTDG